MSTRSQWEKHIIDYCNERRLSESDLFILLRDWEKSDDITNEIKQLIRELMPYITWNIYNADDEDEFEVKLKRLETLMKE